jgi:hypothetical protein
MKINEIIIIIVSVLVFALIPIASSVQINVRVKQIIGVLYAIFALVSVILSIIELYSLKKSINNNTATDGEIETNLKNQYKAGGLAGLGGVLIIATISIFYKNK